MKDFKIVKYSEEHKSIWDQFVKNSKNGTFLFERDYMDYHSDRFKDFSLMFFVKDKLLAILPAHLESDILYSHNGLTYGGIISDYQIKTADIIEIFEKIKEYLRETGIRKINYKVIPHIFHLVPAEEDLYALYFNKASLVKSDFSAFISLQEHPCKDKNKITRNISKSIKNGLEIKRNDDFRSFWNILEQTLKEKYNTKRLHNIADIELLVSRFPEKIKLYSAYKDDYMIAGIVIYESNPNVAHVQYQAISEEGKEYYALDYLYHNLTDIYQQKVKYLNMGSSIIKETNLQNLDLLRYKETLGARIIQHDTYELEIS